MTQENKELLLRDLCTRLPYDLMVDYKGESYNVLGITHGRLVLCKPFMSHTLNECPLVKEVKPYLFPLSSMTEEQWKELRNLIYENFTLDEEFNEGLSYKTYGDILVWLDEKPINECYFIFDYFNKNHFDYRGLIEKSLALDATNLGIYE